MKPKTSIIRITKIEAVHRQLFTALSLYFQDGDPASIHVLACSAREILRVLNTTRGKGPMLLDEDLLPPELRKGGKARKRNSDPFSDDYNFLKHGSSNPDDFIDLRPDRTEQLLLDGVHKLNEIAGVSFDLGMCFLFYMALSCPELFGDSFVDLARKFLGVHDLAGVSRKDFLKRHSRKIIASKDKKSANEVI